MNMSISLLIVDDHTLMRDALGRQLESEPDIVVVAVGNADSAVTEAVTVKPDLVLMDIDMPGLSCFDAAKTIQTHCAGTRIAFLSAFFNDRYIEQALAVQAVGYLTKGEPLETVIGAIRTMADGGSYFSPEVQQRIIVDAGGTRLARNKRSRTSTLTPREMEILRYLARGMSREEIARTVHRSAKTIHTHAVKLMKKLDIHDRVELARFAIREGLAEA